MTKGKYGLNLMAVAIFSFVLAFFGLLEALILVLAYALILEKDMWLSRQVFQALYLRVGYVIVTTVIGWIFTALNALFGLFDAYGVINFLASVHNVIRFILEVGLFVMALMAVLRLTQNKDAGLPLISKLVDATFGIGKKKEKQQAASYQAPPYSQPVYQPSAEPVYTQPVYQPSAEPAPPVQPEPSPVAAPEPQPEEPLVEKEEAMPETPPPTGNIWYCAGCGNENTGNFCRFCGKPKPSL
ncbi:MAG: hypothetical protein KBG64_04680 [Clostridia bacterium]|nr:hypothetical protein [Clostridia bacterium]